MGHVNGPKVGLRGVPKISEVSISYRLDSKRGNRGNSRKDEWRHKQRDVVCQKNVEKSRPPGMEVGNLGGEG